MVKDWFSAASSAARSSPSTSPEILAMVSLTLFGFNYRPKFCLDSGKGSAEHGCQQQYQPGLGQITFFQ